MLLVRPPARWLALSAEFSLSLFLTLNSLLVSLCSLFGAAAPPRNGSRRSTARRTLKCALKPPHFLCCALFLAFTGHFCCVSIVAFRDVKPRTFPLAFPLTFSVHLTCVVSTDLRQSSSGLGGQTGLNTSGSRVIVRQSASCQSYGNPTGGVAFSA